MAYSPPGVTTVVQVANNIVQLPGGTRVLALIGCGQKTLSTTDETVTQTSSYISLPLDDSVNGITSIQSIYDYTGPGGAQIVYSPAGQGQYGEGYYVTPTGATATGTSIAWAPSANPYPASTTPPLGSSFVASFGYTGTTVNSTGLVLEQQQNLNYSATASGAAYDITIALDIPNVTTINAVYSGNNITSGHFPATGVGISGAGWFQSGTSLIWNNGAYPTFAAASLAGQIPASGALYGVNYSYSGTIANQSIVQASGYTEQIILPFTGNTTIFGLANVSGNGVIYPASGTAGTGTDAYGYSISGTGYLLTGTTNDQFVSWGAVPTGAYTHSYSTTPLPGNNYYVNYTYNKSGLDYAPQNFVDQNVVVQTYGPEGVWFPVTGNTGNVTYQLAHLNPVTLASRLAFDNGCSIVNITQISGLGLSAGDFQGPLNELQQNTVDIIVPLTVGSGASLTEVSTASKIQMMLAVQAHCDTMSLPQNAKERVEVGSIGVANIGNNANDPNTYLYAVGSFDDERVTVIAPGACVVQLQDPSGAYQNITVDSAFMAAAYAGLSCNPLSDVATPLTRQNLVDFIGLNAQSPNHSMTSYLNIEKNILAAAGTTVIDTLGAQIYVRQQLTTNQANPAVGEFSVVTSTDYVSQAVRYTCNQFIGKKLIPAIVVPAVKATILATMAALVQDQLISGIGGITVTLSPTSATTLIATVQYVPVFPLNYIQVTFTISTSL